jgi:hypothetical protein
MEAPVASAHPVPALLLFVMTVPVATLQTARGPAILTTVSLYRIYKFIFIKGKMSKFSEIIASLIQTSGVLVFALGILTIIGLNSIFTGSENFKIAVTIFSLATGSPFLLGGILIFGFGELIHLVNRVVENTMPVENEQ